MASQGSARNSETPDASDDKAMGSARETVDSTRTTFKLREVRTGEQRLLGVLVAIDCGAPGVRFRPDTVYLTWTPPAAGHGDGTTAAVESLPKGYVP
jgi:hypothetical protein